MGFRRSSLLGLRMLPGFEGYSLHEDVYLSLEAGRTGPVLIDPKLRIRHHHSPVSRDSRFEVGRMNVLNHFQLLRLYGAGRWRCVLAYLSFLCLIARSTARNLRRGPAANTADFDFARGQLSALNTLLMGRSARGLEPVPRGENE
jgi:hypothetical protein